MSEMELPAGWAWVCLGDLLREPLRNGHSARSTKEPDGVRTLSLSAVTQDDFSDRNTKITVADPDRVSDLWLEAGDILIQRSNTPELVGTSAIYRGPDRWAIFPDLLIRVRLDSRVDSHYVALFLRSRRARSYFKSRAKGLAGSMPKIDQAAIGELEVPIPPLAEQRRIVEALEGHLSRLDAAVALVNHATKRAAHLHRCVTDITLGYTAPEGGESALLPSPAGSDDGALPTLPIEWEWWRLGDLSEVVGGVTKDQKKQSDPEIPEVPYLRVANVQRGKLDLTRVTRIRVPAKKAEQLRLLPGDVLLNEGGDRDKLGRGWIWDGQIAGAIHQNHVFRARVREGRLHAKLLSWHANRSGTWFEVNGKQSVNLASISLSKIKSFPVPVPPREEQVRILDRIEGQVSLLENAEALTAQAVSGAEALRRAILNRAFTGALVPQNPADELATALLARIQADRAAQPKAKRPRRAPAAPHKAKTAAAPAPAAPAPTPAPTHAVQQEFDL